MCLCLGGGRGGFPFFLARNVCKWPLHISVSGVDLMSFPPVKTDFR